MTLVGRHKNRIAASHDVLRIRTGSLLSLAAHLFETQACIHGGCTKRCMFKGIKMCTRKLRATDSGMARFRAQLICGVCLDFLREPKLLDCAHSFCQECLENVVKNQSIYRTADSPLHDNDVECPCCRQPTRLQAPGSDAVKALRTNFNLKELVEIVSEEEKEEARHKLNLAPPVGSLQGAKQCVKGVGHQAMRQVERTQCKEHVKPLDFFCDNCNELFCCKCLKVHKKHDYHQVDDALDSLRSLVQPACEVAFHAEKKMKELFKKKDVISENRERTTRVIETFFDKMHKALDERKSAVISTLRKYTDTQFTKLDEHYQTLEEARTTTLDIVGTIENSLQHSEDASILMKAKEFRDSLENHQESILEITQMASKSKQSSSFLQFKGDNSLLLPFSELGTLHVCSHDPHSNHISILGTVVVSNDDSNTYIVDGKEIVQYVSSTNRPQLPTIDKDSDHTYHPNVPSPSPPKASPRPFCPEPPPDSQEDVESSTPEAELLSEESESEYEEVQTETISLPHSQNAPPIIEPVKVISNDQLCSPDSGEQVYPCGICCTGNYDNFIVTDTHNHCLRLVDHTGEFLEKIGSEGKASGQFKEPVAVAVSKDNFIFVAERETARIQKFTSHGMHILKFGQRALYGHQLNDPWGVAVSPADGNVHISDWDKSRIFVYSPSGRFLRLIGREGFIKFKLPAGIAFDNQGRLLVVDRGRHCVWSLTADGNQILGKIGSGYLHFPYGIAATSDGSIIVTESGKDRISMFSVSGELIRCFGRSGSEPGMFNHPRHICINRKGQLIVADEMNQRLQIFELPEIPQPPLVLDGSLYEELPPLNT